MPLGEEVFTLRKVYCRELFLAESEHASGSQQRSGAALNLSGFMTLREWNYPQFKTYLLNLKYLCLCQGAYCGDGAAAAANS